jgi:hypothetical protein
MQSDFILYCRLRTPRRQLKQRQYVLQQRMKQQYKLQKHQSNGDCAKGNTCTHFLLYQLHTFSSRQYCGFGSCQEGNAISACMIDALYTLVHASPDVYL